MFGEKLSHGELWGFVCLNHRINPIKATDNFLTVHVQEVMAISVH